MDLENEHPLLTDLDVMMILNNEHYWSGLKIVTHETDVKFGFIKLIDEDHNFFLNHVTTVSL